MHYRKRLCYWKTYRSTLKYNRAKSFWNWRKICKSGEKNLCYRKDQIGLWILWSSICKHERHKHTFACEICGDKSKTLDDLETM